MTDTALTSSPTDTPQTGWAARVRSVRRRANGVTLLRVLSRGAAIVFAWVLLVAIVDARYGLDYAWRLLAAAAALALVVRWARRELWPTLRRPWDDEDAALRIESHLPDAHSRVITAAQFAREGRTDPWARRVGLEADAVVDGVEPAAVVRAAPAVRWLSAAVGLLAALSLGAAVVGTGAVPLLLRALLVPGVERPTRTRIELLLPDAHRIRRGDALRVDVRATGRIPDAPGVIEVTHASGDRTNLPLERDTSAGAGEGRFAATIASVDEPLKYVVRLGDARAGPRAVAVVDAPEVAQLRILQSFPAYARQPDRLLERGDVRILAGSSLRLELRTTRAADARRSVLVRRPGEAIVPLVAADDPMRFTTEPLVPTVDEHWSLLPRDTEGFEARSPTEFDLRLLRDEPPALELLRPTRDAMPMTAWGTPAIAFRATDDIGLAGVRLRYLVFRQSQFELPGGNGLRLSLFANARFEGDPVTQPAANVESDWGTAAPAAGLPSDDFTARFEGHLVVPASGNYAFRAEVDDRARLWIGDDVLLDNFVDRGRTESRNVPLAAGVYRFRLDFGEGPGHARVRLLWRRPGGDWQVIPRSNFFDSPESLARAIDGAAESVDLWSDSGQGSTRTLVEESHAFALSPLGLAPGDRVQWWIEARDLSEGAGNIVGSRVNLITVATEDEVRRAILERMGDYMQEIDQVERRQDEITRDVGDLLDDD